MPSPNLLNWIEVSRSALTQNVKALAKLARGKTLAPSVKANAYGHGLPQIVSMLTPQKQVGYLSVHSVEEAIGCRDQGWKRRILLMGPVAPSAVSLIAECDIEPVVVDKETLSALGKLSHRTGKEIRAHIKLETGTNRQGITEKELPAFANIFKKYPRLKAYGASTHFANIEDTTSHEYALYQLDQFQNLVTAMRKLGIGPTMRHTASSAAMILFNKTHFDVVRPGISLYGHWPSKETYVSFNMSGKHNDLFAPVLSWRTRITQLKSLKAGEFVGYGCTYRTTSPTKLAILPIGYYDGYPRALSNQAYVLIKGKRAPVRGRICMNLMMVDVTHVPGVKLHDPATLIGRDGRERISAEQLAAQAGTISYEVLARLGGHILRLIVA
jgi:alanine racemase